eukprot:PhM_4_TR14695/c0_g1_i1/m.68328
MFCRTSVSRLNWRQLYHHQQAPRRRQLEKYLRRREDMKGILPAAEATRLARSPGDEENHARAPKTDVNYRYNRWWVSNNGDFVEQVQVVEDPSVVLERKSRLSSTPTSPDVWKKAQKQSFTPIKPFIKVLESVSDSDAKHLYPTNVPKWKEFMYRTKPMIPRTWY